MRRLARLRARLAEALTRRRVPLGFVCGAVTFWLAHPTRQTLLAGGVVAALGEALRIWAAGHLDKGREVTSSGPYRWVRHPLYLGSTMMAIGLGIAARSLVAALLVGVYIGTTVPAAIATEEAVLREKFGDAYLRYREGRAPRTARRFSLSRVVVNREYRAVAGFAVAMALLAWKLGRE